ncbi:uncharacterized protein LOC123553924 [Mercenaria mercenaria]|uniref:uncharacterized protein LOC123553924 n=1 Tax=Mercenaria mercenaria TaxID=6596 RepID=UPI00234F305E|nr:uncharacterized protein LOC123553924 [Mercenaria mercenaria]
MMYALKEEQKKEIEEMDRNGVWERIKDRLKKDSQDSRSDEELLENFKPQENEFTEVRRLHRNTYAKRENLKSDDPYSRAVFEKWRNHEEAVFSSVRTTMANRRERSSLYQNGEIPPMNTDTPCRFIRSGDSPILPYHSTPKFAWKMDNSNARNKRLISRDTPPPWTHNGYGIEPSLVDNVTQLEGQNVDVWSNQKHESTIEGFTEADTERDIRTENKEYHLKQPDKIQKKLHNDIEHCTFNKNSCNYYNVTHEKAVDNVSVAHNILTIRGNTLKKQMIESTPTKFDSWKENEKDESYLHPNMKQYKLAPELAQYGSVEHNNQIKNNNIMFKKKLENITSTLDTWKTKDTDCSDQQPKMKGYINGDKSAEYDFKENNYLTQSDNAVKKTREDKIQNNIDTM